MLTLKYKFIVDPLYFIPMADWQVGDTAFAEEALRKYVKWVQDRDNAMVGLVGDIFETHKKNSRATDIWEMALKPREAMERATEIIYPITDRILFMQEGNHCDRMYQEFGRTPTEEFALRLGLSLDIIAPRGLVTHLKVGDVDYSIYSLHGWGGARTTGGQVNKSLALGEVVKDADVYLIAHEHRLFQTRQDCLVNRRGKTEVLRQNFIGVGGFCNYTKFQEGLALRLPNVGAPRIRFNGTRRDVHVSI